MQLDYVDYVGTTSPPTQPLLTLDYNSISNEQI